MKKSGHRAKEKAANILFDYLYCRDEPVPADAIMGFGHFNMNIPLRCAELYYMELSRLIIFTGGKGSGSSGLKRPEAEYFYETVRDYYPEIPAETFILEERSQNTGENLQFTLSILRKNYPDLAPPEGIKSLLIVASPLRQRRVWLTCRKEWPSVTLACCPPLTTLEEETELFAAKGLILNNEMLGELQRIQEYPERGFIVQEKVPVAIQKAAHALQLMK